MAARKLGPGLPGAKDQKYFDFGDTLGLVEAKEYKEENHGPVHNDIGSSALGGDNRTNCDDKDNKPLLPQRSRYGLSRIALGILKIAAVLIALAAAIVSSYNSFEFFKDLRPIPLAILTSFSFVGAAIMLPDFSLALARNNHKVVAAILFSCGLMAICFCMITTLSVLYNTRTARTGADYAKTQVASERIKLVSDARGEKIRIDSELVQTNGLISSTQAKIDAIPTSETLSPASQALVGRLNKYLKLKSDYESRLKDLDTIISAPEGSAIPIRSDFYSFLSSVFGVDSPDTVEFFIGAIPSVFLELIAPIMIGVALFL